MGRLCWGGAGTITHACTRTHACMRACNNNVKPQPQKFNHTTAAHNKMANTGIQLSGVVVHDDQASRGAAADAIFFSDSPGNGVKQHGGKVRRWQSGEPNPNPSDDDGDDDAAGVPRAAYTLAGAFVCVAAALAINARQHSADALSSRRFDSEKV